MSGEYLSLDVKRLDFVASEQQRSRPGCKVIKHYSCSTQMSMKFIMLINIKLPTTVGILIFMSMINTASEHLKARKVYFRFY